MQIEFPGIVIVINVVVRIITALIFLSFIIPLQIKEANVKNGLRKLRVQLLISGIMLFFINTIGLIIIFIKPYISMNILNQITAGVTYFNSFGFLVVAYLQYKIYHQEYSPENKEIHKNFESEKLRAM